MFKRLEENKTNKKICLDLGLSENQSTIVSQNYKGDDVKDFLNGTFSLGNYKELIDLEKGSSLLTKTIIDGGLIIVIVDYDNDGVSCGAIADIFFKQYLGYDNFVILNNEREYGNGVNSEMVNRVTKIMERREVSLIVTADHGSADDERYEYLKNLGLDIIVTDHHTIPKSGNPIHVDAFINPQRDGGNFNTNISGCTTLFLLLYDTRLELLKEDYKLKRDDPLNLMMTITAITIITDQMDLTSPFNRRFYIRGIEVMDRSKGLWKQISDRLSLPSHFTTQAISFGIGGLFNSTGRMGKAYLTTRLLTATENSVIRSYLDMVMDINDERKLLQNRLMGVALNQLSRYMKRYPNTLVGVLGEGYGVAGIIAGMVGDKFNKPVYMFSKIGSKIKGSGRGIVGDFNIKGVIDAFREKYPDTYVEGGGHKGAAGVELYMEDLGDFINVFEDYTIKQNENVGDLTNWYNLKLNIADVNLELFDDLYGLDPYGMKFETPILYVKGKVTKVYSIGKAKEHYIIKLEENGSDIELIFFSVGNAFKGIEVNDVVELTFTIGMKNFRGKETLSLVGEQINLIRKSK